MLVDERHRADAVFEGGGVKGIAFAGAIAAAWKAGVKEWVNLAGTSAGSIVSALLVAGYDAAGLHKISPPTTRALPTTRASSARRARCG